MTSREIRNRFLSFFERRGHAIIPSASLVPENDPSVLFTTAGMQPLVPYLLGTPHPKGKRLANIQKCVRTQDIEEVGDNTHDTFFEMLGNWSLGDYFKKEAITWSYEFLTSKEEGLGLDPRRLYVTVFGGNEEVPEKDLEALSIWKSLGIPEERIYFMEGYANWWSPGDNGPCGPDSEMFYDVIGDLNLTSKDAFIAADDAQQVVEIWNDVFMEYEKKDGKVVGKLTNKNVDTGAGLER
ncbi:MAG: alanine--tRNA ligase-related protein, partial [Patescibacteria group bacterium]|nr:alanine--tRNA ligase-related protein [Patescibacteria group bacterium]